MFQFTKEVDYGIQLISALRKLKSGELLSLRNFSKDAKISFLFLQRIVKKLREAKIVKSVKGAQGGYQLDKEFKNLTIKNVVEALEGEYAVTNCLKKGCYCPREGKCDSQKIFKLVNDKMCKMLGEMRVSDVV